MKTLIIFNEIPVKSPQFAIVDGDYSRFHDVTFNIERATPHPFEKECNDFLYDDDKGVERIRFTHDKSLIEAKQWNKVAIITFFA